MADPAVPALAQVPHDQPYAEGLVGGDAVDSLDVMQSVALKNRRDA